MKFGKRLKNAQRPEWVYLDYKYACHHLSRSPSACTPCRVAGAHTMLTHFLRALKQLIKQLFEPATVGARETVEAAFREELYNSISSVNAFFGDKERQLLLTLASGTDVGASFYEEVSQLYAFCILNFLAVLKITKKHDKSSSKPLRPQVEEHMFTQSFYLALEHSYLFEACKAHLAEHAHEHALHLSSRTESPSQPTAAGEQRARSHSAFDLLRLVGFESPSPTPTQETLDVPVHFERCLMGYGLVASPHRGGGGATIDFAALRRPDATVGTRNVAMQIECLLDLAFAQATAWVAKPHARTPATAAQPSHHPHRHLPPARHSHHYDYQTPPAQPPLGDGGFDEGIFDIE